MHSNESHQASDAIHNLTGSESLRSSFPDNGYIFLAIGATSFISLCIILAARSYIQNLGTNGYNVRVDSSRVTLQVIRNSTTQ